MKIDEAFARYIINLQESIIMERGEDLQDIQYREDIESHFPKIKEDRINKEFEEWVQEEKVFKDEKLIVLRFALTHKQDRANGELETIIEMFDKRREYLTDKFMSDPHARKEFNTFRAVKKMQS
jgi:hypothetical protein